MENAFSWIKVFEISVPIILALIGLISTNISNRKKMTEDFAALIKELKQESKETNAKVDAVGKQLSDHIKEDEADKAKQARTRILRFYDEVCEGKKHSESHFEDILDDIDFYESYCAAHKDDFKNHRGKAAMDYIDETFKKIKATGGFLTHAD